MGTFGRPFKVWQEGLSVPGKFTGTPRTVLQLDQEGQWEDRDRAAERGGGEHPPGVGEEYLEVR